MINPRQFQPVSKKVLEHRFAPTKYYQPFINKPTARTFRRASEAQAYAERLHARWVRLYDAAVVAMTEPKA